jgi:aromatic ring hydroxylase
MVTGAGLRADGQYGGRADSQAARRVVGAAQLHGKKFGARHELYERNYSGNQDQIRLDALRFSRNRGDFDQFNAFVDQCMSEYDLDGWTASPWADAPWAR